MKHKIDRVQHSSHLAEGNLFPQQKIHLKGEKERLGGHFKKYNGTSSYNIQSSEKNMQDKNVLNTK